MRSSNKDWVTVTYPKSLDENFGSTSRAIVSCYTDASYRFADWGNYAVEEARCRQCIQDALTNDLPDEIENLYTR